MIGTVRRRAVIVLTAGTLALAAGCEEHAMVARGFGSQQVLHVRDSSFSFFAQQENHVYFVTGRGDVGGTPSYSDLDVMTGVISDLGPIEPDLGPATPPGRYACAFSGVGAETTTRTMSITDTQTGVTTVIEDVYATRPYCPADDDPQIHAWLKSSDGLMTLWRGPYTALEQATLPVLVKTALFFKTAASLVQAASPEAPTAFGLYRLDETELTASEIVAPALATAAWADGATPAGSLASNSIAEPLYLLSAGDGRYVYTRAMSDGGQTLFLGPRATDTANELALFRVEEPLPTSVPMIEPYSYRSDGLWSRRPAWLIGDATHLELRVWHPARAMITSCPWSDLVPYGLTDPAGDNIAFRNTTGSGNTAGGALLLVVPSAGAANACRVLADRDATAVDFSPDGRAMYWLVQPTTGVLDAQLWIAAADGSGARLVGSGLIGNDLIGDLSFGPPPRFVGDSQLELTLGGDLVWIDVHDDPVTLHYIADHVFGSGIGVGRWLISGYDYSDQDDTGQLGLINRDNGETRPISPAVAAYTTPDIPSDGRIRELPETIRVVYLVRGRNPSPQDGVWMATIPTAELQ